MRLDRPWNFDPFTYGYEGLTVQKTLPKDNWKINRLSFVRNIGTSQKKIFKKFQIDVDKNFSQPIRIADLD